MRMPGNRSGMRAFLLQKRAGCASLARLKCGLKLWGDNMKSLITKLAELLFALAVLACASVLFVDPAAARVGAKCGGFAGLTCAGNEFCDKPTGACFFPDGEGTCVHVPGLCPQIYLPVCGCNGKTYSNDCVRQRARVSKAHNGKCAETP